MSFTPNPIAFTVFGIDIRWYAVLICSGMIIAGAIAYRRAPRCGTDPDGLLDVLLFAIPAGIIGARAWYVFFNRQYYHSFFDVINMRAGGLAIHGGLIFGLAAAAIVCRRKKIDFIPLFDLAVPCIALAQSIGRWGNYFNSEAYGSPTDLPWAITIDGVKVHPTFLYESIWCLMLFFVLSHVWKHSRFKGQTTCLYVILYSLERFFVEQLRTDSLLAGPAEVIRELQLADCNPAGVEGALHAGKFLIYPFRTAQFISLIGVIAGISAYFILKKRDGRHVQHVAIEKKEA